MQEEPTGKTVSRLFQCLPCVSGCLFPSFMQLRATDLSRPLVDAKLLSSLPAPVYKLEASTFELVPTQGSYIHAFITRRKAPWKRAFPLETTSNKEQLESGDVMYSATDERRKLTMGTNWLRMGASDQNGFA